VRAAIFLGGASNIATGVLLGKPCHSKSVVPKWDLPRINSPPYLPNNDQFLLRFDMHKILFICPYNETYLLELLFASLFGTLHRERDTGGRRILALDESSCVG
jgi:hypothetical protein